MHSRLGLLLLVASASLFAGCTAPGPAMTPTATPMAVRDYDALASKMNADVTRAMNQVGPLVSDPRYGDSAWRNSLSSAGAALVAVHQDAQAATPPLCMKDVHLRLLDSLELFAQGGASLSDGVRAAAGDPARTYSAMEAASLSLNTATSSYAAAAKQLSETSCDR